MARIRWGLALTLSLSGLVYAALTILAWINGLEHWVALITLAGVGKLVVLLERQAPVRSAFAAGFFTAVFALWGQMAFVDIYFQNNPEYLSAEVPFGLSPVSFTLLFSPLGGVMGGLLAAITAWLVSTVVQLLWRSEERSQ
ncbi:MAG: hypothetical protein AAFX54_16170 [Pseudomonadota bacterium]